MPNTPCQLWTIGHSTRTFDDFLALLRAWRIETLADVRTVPRSRRHPHFNTDALASTLPEQGIAYVHIPELGARMGIGVQAVITSKEEDLVKGAVCAALK